MAREPSSRPDAYLEAQWKTETSKSLTETRERLVEVKTRVDEHERRLETKVSKDTFTPIKLLVYGLTGTILTGVIGAAVKLLFNAKGVAP